MWHKRNTIIFLVFSTLIITATTVLSQTSSNTFQHIRLSVWVEQMNFAPVLLLPEPVNAPLKIGPLYSEESNMVELAYVDSGGPNHEGATHNIFQSDSFEPIFGNDGPLKIYDADREDVTREQRTIELDNQATVVEIRRNKQFPNDGVFVFEIGGTSVAHNWQNTTAAQALSLLEERLQVITAEDTKLIGEFDQRIWRNLD